tara:strand:+ start:335 stop:1033 length:699 start_codon:yes stop_codon:yes gene_type:complete
MARTNKIKKQILQALGLNSVNLGFQGKTTDGTIIVSESETLEAGASVSILTEDGTTVPLPVGEYEMEDGTSFSVTTEGTIAEIYSDEVEEEAMEEETTEEAPAEEVVEEVVTEIADATTDIADAINEATPEEVTPEIAEKAAEIAVAVIEEKAEEVKEEVLSKQSKAILSVVKKELGRMRKEVKTLRSKLSKTAGGNKVSYKKFSHAKRKEVSQAEYKAMTQQERYLYNLGK